MKKVFYIVFLYIFSVISLPVFAHESKDQLKIYLSDMNKIVVEVEEAMRNLSMNILPAKNAAEQVASAIEKFQVLKSPAVFLKDHNKMLSAFRNIRDGLELFSDAERERSVALVRKGSSLLKESAMGIRATAEKEGLIPTRAESAKPILPSQSPSVIAGTSPTPSPHISSPDIQADFISVEAGASAYIDLQKIPNTPNIPEMPVSSLDATRSGLPLLLTATGEIVSIGPYERDDLAMEIKDASGNKLKLNFNPQNSRVLKDNKIVDAKEVKIGEFCYTVYAKKDGQAQALFINVLKPEDMASFKATTGSDPFDSISPEKTVP